AMEKGNRSEIVRCEAEFGILVGGFRKRFFSFIDQEQEKRLIEQLDGAMECEAAYTGGGLLETEDEITRVILTQLLNGLIGQLRRLRKSETSNIQAVGRLNSAGARRVQ